MKSMLKSFEVENFRGFQNLLKFDFKAGKYDFNSEMESDGVVKNAIVYGPNGIGKSALGLALFDIILHLTDKLRFEPQRLLPYRNLNRANDLTSFKYVFTFDGDEVIYEYKKIDPLNLAWERLELNGERLLECDYSQPQNPYVKPGLVDNLNTNLSDGQLSLVKYIYKNTPTGTVAVVSKLVGFCENMLWYRSLSQGNEFAGHESVPMLLTEILKKNGRIPDFEKFLSGFGLSYRLGFEQINNQNVLFAYFEGGQKAPFESIASTGTSALYLFYCWSVSAFCNVSFLFIDEFDAFLHYEAAETVVKLLNRQPHFQTILTTHNTSLLSNEFSRPDCSFIMSRDNGKGEDVRISSLPNLTEREIRKVHNLEKMYRAGAFSGNV